MGIGDYYSKLDSIWKKAAEGGALILGILTAFLVLPPFADFNEGVLKNFTTFLSSVIFIVFYICTIKFGMSDDRAWLRNALLLFFLAAGLFLGYTVVLNVYTCEYNELRFLKGIVYTEFASEYLSNSVYRGCTRLVEDFGGVISDVWSDNSIIGTKVLLFLLYILSYASFAFALLILLHIIRNMEKNNADESTSTDNN